MKQNVTVKSEDRNLFGVIIRQETKTGMLNLSDLQSAYDKVKYEKDWVSNKTSDDVLRNPTNHERIYYILEKQGFIKPQICGFMEEMKKPAKALKKYKAYKTTGARETRTVWANPYVWLLVAMEMNPELYATTVIWLGDNLITNRIEAGDFFNEFTKSVKSICNNPNYIKLAMALNHIVFGIHETGIRNNATQSQLLELIDVQKKLAFVIDSKFIKTHSQLLSFMRDMYREKYNIKTLK